ncbi:MAG: hypothetical protein PWQ37_544 [Candidatus Petromonas sp.]|nr:hypothetical protein [Candidatus Petromonas sp.]
MKNKSFQNKEELFQAALDEFTQKSYKDASLNNILKKAGMSKGAFYYHFKNKEDLYFSILEEVYDAEHEFIEEHIKEIGENITEKNFFEILKIYGEASLEFSIRHPKYYHLVQRLLKEDEKIIRNFIDKKLNEHMEGLFEKLILEAIQRGELRNDFYLEFIKKLIKNLFQNFSFIFLQDIDEFDFDKLIKTYDDYIDFIENGLGKK